MFFLAFAVMLSGCAQKDNIPDDKIKAVTTIGMITDIVENVGKDKVSVQGLMGSGVDPHLYKATEGDVTRLSEADIIFYNGLHLEARMGEVLEKLGEMKKTVAVTDYIGKEALLDFPAYPGQYDPHVWFDVSMWISAVEKVRDSLIDIDPDNGEEYGNNAEHYISQLEGLGSYVRSKAGEVPEQQRVLVTAHDAFQYFGKAYGFEVLGLQGISTESEAGTKDVQDLVNFIVERKIKAIFVETSIPERNIKAVQEAAQSKGWDVKIGGYLYSDAMGDEGTFEGTYIGMVTHNIDTISGALR